MKLPRHPFTVAGSIRQCWLFVYRLPAEIAQPLLPSPLQPVTRGGFAFMNIVVCRLDGMRPSLLPESLGLGFWHVAYRLHVQAQSAHGRLLEGLHFLRSDCDRWLVARAGNLLTDFHFHHAAIRVTATDADVHGVIDSAAAPARFHIDRHRTPALSAGSPFSTLDEAAEFLRYKPYGLSVEDGDTLQVVRVRRRETAWQDRVVAALDATWQFPAAQHAALELCYEVQPIDYVWERGHSVRVVPCA
jgi:hypothetical protein